MNDSKKIHPTAIVSKKAILGNNVKIGPYAIVEEDSQIGDNCVLHAHAQICKNVVLGAHTQIYHGAIIGSDPQDLKYKGQKSFLRIGTNCKIREYCTLNRGTEEGSSTLVMDNVLIMAYSHVAHDCLIESEAVLANGVQMGGHVELGKGCVIGGNTAIHQFCKVGKYSFVGGTLKIDRHVPPFIKALGNPLSFAGINHIAFKRNELQISLEDVQNLYRKLYMGKENWEDVLKGEPEEKVPEIVDFFTKNRGKILGRKHRT